MKTEVGVAGTGSMYPTFPKGSAGTDEENELQTVARPSMRQYPTGFTLFGRSFFTSQLQHGDIVSFQSDRLDRAVVSSTSGLLGAGGYVKRIIGLPGDTIELRDGFVYRNKMLITEPYTAAPRSTFGGDSIRECSPINIPQGFALVMGDNRKASNDSRYALGLLPLENIDHVLPWQEQQVLYSSIWRDASKDFQTANTTEFNEQEFIRLLNDFRKANKRKALIFQPKLRSSAEMRAKVMLQYDDFSFAASASGFPMEKALEKAGYSNIVYGEAPVLGYYTAQELMNYFQAQPRWREYLLNSEYQDIGVASFIGELRHCPTQIMVLHLAGYKPATYAAEVVQSWKDAIDSSAAMLESWKKTRELGPWYDQHKADVDHLLQILEERQKISTAIHTKMTKREWLTKEDTASMDRHEKLGDESSALAQKLNKWE